ncbi:ATP-dependent RNA helicase DHX30 isoform X2 [Bufo gargarizans]|uniref:ATP-dependent RNA helicase DHX30 isoform X2 n=1 Tax=Bufo gargarizans TaxID=30331 RepID=UPI001CF25C41|nr:ATP-dependent RNA helicase DHX30 isoform X2 [Bufo gargarizans]
MAAPSVVMPLLSRLLCRVHGHPIRPLCSGRYRANPLRAEERPAAAGDMAPDTNLLKQFPSPKNLLHCVISQGLRTSQVRDKLTYTHSGSGSKNRVTLRLKWPKLIEVEGYGPKKIDAERQAAAMACKILQDLGLLGPSDPVQIREDAEPVSSRTRTRIRESRVVPVEVSDGDAEAARCLRVFSNPKHLLSSVIQVATSCSSADYVKYEHVGGRIKTCHLTLHWPEPLTFVARGQRRTEAERKAAALACQKLKDLGLLDPHNQPLTNVMYNISSVQKVKEQHRQAKRFQVPEHLLQRIEDYFWRFPLEPGTRSSFQENYDEASSMEASDESCASSDFSDPITGRPYTPLSEAEASHISRSLEERWDSSIALQELPTDEHRELILSAIKKHQVVVIAGDTGCGKTTRIPRYILEDAILCGHGAQCNMLITQPRRISAVSVAHRVGQELGPSLRHNVGYQVRLESDLPPRGGALLFCTVGVLLKKLQTNPELEGVSHVVVDEVHERDVNTDFLLILLQQVLDLNPNIKIVLMSATGDNERISRYFGDCPIVRVPGFMYPVKEHYLEDILPVLGRRSYQKPQTREECVPDLDLISDVILQIDKCGPPGGILCFLPGWQEIRRVQEILQQQRNRQHLILPVHSNVPLMNQQAIFESPPPGVRKIVLATNIAETSVTIDDIVHVVDTGMHKEQRYDLKTKVSCLDTTWVSKSNVTQRRGRAGRCQPGFSYHLFTREQHQAMPTFQVAEILRIPLENLVVQAKIHTPEMTAVEFLSQALESPDRHAVMDAVRFLQEISVLDKNEELTLLGQRVASISTDPSLAKAIVLASIFRCLHPLLVIVACLTKDPFQGGIMNRTEVNKVKTMFSGQSCSDHLAFVRIYQTWKEVLGTRNNAARDDFVEDNVLSKSALRFIQGLVAQFSSNVQDAALVDEAHECMNRSALCNQLSDQEELVKGILLAGLYPKLIQVRRGYVVRGKFRPSSLLYKTKSGPVQLHKSTVNRDVKNFVMPWLTYFQAVKSSNVVFVRDSAMVHPLAVLLLTDSSVSMRDNGEQMVVSLSDTDLLKLESDPRTIALIGDLRCALSRMVERNLQDQLPPLSFQEEGQYTELLHILVDLLNGTAHCFTEQAAAEE